MFTLIVASLVSSLFTACWVAYSRRKNPKGQPWVSVLHGVFLLVMLVLAFSPKVTIVVPWDVIPESEVMTAAEGGKSAAVDGLLIIWVVGLILTMGRFVVSRMRLNRWILNSELPDQPWIDSMVRCSDRLGMDNVDVRSVRGITSPVVVGLFRPAIVVPFGCENWSSQTRDMVMLHELCHIKRKDLWWRFLLDLTVALHWFNPFLRWINHRLREQCEYACDATVIAHGTDKKTYINALCDVVLEMRGRAIPASAIAMATGAPLDKRVDSMMGARKLSLPWVSLVISLMAGLSVFALHAVRFTPSLEVGNPSAAPVEMPSISEEEINLRHTANPFPG